MQTEKLENTDKFGAKKFYNNHNKRLNFGDSVRFVICYVYWLTWCIVLGRVVFYFGDIYVNGDMSKVRCLFQQIFVVFTWIACTQTHTPNTA